MNRDGFNEAVNNLIIDLRNRRLLPVVGLLIVAIVAIPMLLKEEAPVPIEAPPAPAGAAVASSDGILDSISFVSSPQVRDYKDRLASFKAINPFKDRYAKRAARLEKQAEKAAAAAESGGGGGLTGQGGSAPGGNAKGVGGDTGGGATGGGGDSGGGGSTGGGDGGTVTEVIIYSWEIDVKVGQIGDGEKKKGVKAGKFLPGEKRPIVQFLEGDFEETQAAFYVSRNVGKVDTNGNCIRSKKDCEFLILEEGQEAKFFYEPEGRTYRLKLGKVHLTQTKADGDLTPEELQGLYPGSFFGG